MAYSIPGSPFPQLRPAKRAGRRLPRLRGMALIHTCYRITDIDRSVAFYKALGFEEVGRLPIREEAVNVFMNQPGDGDMPRLELTYNFGVDSYDVGSGYGHIAITAEDLDATLSRLAEQGIEPEKPPYSVREGGSRLCFVRDPDGYRIELIEKP
jgi:lactoylglutathione lyase